MEITGVADESDEISVSPIRIGGGGDGGGNLITVDGKYAFREGETFDSYEQLLQRMNQHSKESFVYYWRRDSRTVQKAYTKTTRPIASRLKYYLVRFACIYGGMKPQPKRKVSAKPKRTDCPAFVLLRASKCGRKLEVVSLCNDHNHEISAQESQKLPQKRRLSEEVKEEVVEMIKLKIDRKKIIDYVQQRDDKTVTTKDLLNLAARLKAVDLGPIEPLKRGQILQRILHFANDSSIQTVISKELSACEADESAYYQIDETDLIEYISPEHEFGVNENIIDSIVEARKRDIQVDTTDSNNGWPPDDYIAAANTDSISPLLLTDIDDKDIFPIDDDPDNLPDFVDHHHDGNGGCDDSTTGIFGQLTDITDPNFVVYDDFDCSGDKLSPFLNNNNNNNNNSNGVIVYETLTASGIENIAAELLNGNYVTSAELESAVAAGTAATTMMSTMATTKTRIKDISKLDKPNKKHIKKEINRVGRKLAKCRSCRTSYRLLNAQINYLRAKRDKLLAQTELLRMKRKELICDIKRSSRM